MKENIKLLNLYEENSKLEFEFWKEFFELKELFSKAKKELSID